MFSSRSGGLDAVLHWTQPSAFSQFTKEPCTFLACKLYAWHQRRTPAPPPYLDRVTITCIADTHNTQPALPDGDILIHAGDLTRSGTFAELQATLSWLQQQSHKTKIVVAGNHDIFLDAKLDYRPGNTGVAEAEAQRQALDWGDIVYLENSEVTVTCENDRRLRIYGSPLSPRYGNWAFQYERWENVWRDSLPDGVDILVTHGPPRTHLDMRDLACVHLMRELWRVRPRAHVFGHIHECTGVEVLCFNRLQMAYEQTVVAGGGVLSLFWTVIAFVLGLFFPRPIAKCTLVNAAMVGGMRDQRQKNSIQVIV